MQHNKYSNVFGKGTKPARCSFINRCQYAALPSRLMIMPYTFVPKEKYAKAYSALRISTKSAVKLCRAISRKPLVRARRLLVDLASEKRSLGRKHYTKTATEMLALLNSCEKNAESLGMEIGKLFVHASAHTGTIMRRKRRRGNFGSRMKSTNVEMMLIEKGRNKKADIIKVGSKEDLQKAVEKVARQVKEKGAKTEKAEQKKEPAAPA